jgi:lysophospholipase L1-like esterase
VPRGPFAELPGFSKPSRSVLPSGETRRTTYSLPEQTFDFLEKPEYYFDAFHLNAKGRQRFTEALVAELVGQLGSAESHAQSGFQ